MNNGSITRRSLLDWGVRLATVPAVAEFFTAWGKATQSAQHEHAANAPPAPAIFRDYRPLFFSQQDFEVLKAFTEILIPTDETPGAREAYCAEYMDFVLHAMTGHSPSTQEQWRKAMAALKAAGFHAAGTDRRVTLVHEISRPEREAGSKHPAYFAYRLIKRENAFAFYTARAGIIENLDYRGNTYSVKFPGCEHAEHHTLAPDIK